MGGVDSRSRSPGEQELPLRRSSHHLALVQDSSSSKPRGDNGPFQTRGAWSQPGPWLWSVRPAWGSAPTPARRQSWPQLQGEEQEMLGVVGDAPAAYIPAPGGAASPFLLSSSLLADHGQLSAQRAQCWSLLLGMEGLAASQWEPPHQWA